MQEGLLWQLVVQSTGLLGNLLSSEGAEHYAMIARCWPNMVGLLDGLQLGCT